MSMIHLSSDVVLDNVRSFLYAVKERGGLTPDKFLVSQAQKFGGEWAADTVNIGLVAMGKKPAFAGVSSEKQMEIFVANAKRQCGDLLAEIAVLRAAKGK